MTISPAAGPRYPGRLEGRVIYIAKRILEPMFFPRVSSASEAAEQLFRPGLRGTSNIRADRHHISAGMSSLPRRLEQFSTAEGDLDPGMDVPDVSVILVSFNTDHLLDRLFAALDAGRGSLRIQVIVVDNASTDNSLDILRTRYPEAEVIANNSNVGFGRANNQAFERARGRYILLLNTDAFIAPDTLPKTIRHMDEHPDCGVLGVKLVGEDGSVQPSCRYFPTPWNTFLQSTGLKQFFPETQLIDHPGWDPSAARECDWVPGCYYLVRREVIERVGLFDPRYFLYYEEVDHCRAVKASGWKVKYYPDTQVIHIGGESAESTGPLVKSSRQISTLQIESELLYFRKHHGWSGVVGALLLTSVAEGGRALRALVRGVDGAKATAAGQHLSRVFQAAMNTRLGSKPTR